MADFQTLVDDFSTKDTGKWTFEGPADVVAGQCVIPPIASYSSDIIPVEQYNLEDSWFSFKVVQDPTGSGSSTEYYLAVWDGNWTSQYVFFWSGESVRISERHPDPTETWNSGWLPAPASTPYWMLVAEDSGTMYWKYSLDGSTWTTIASRATAFSVADAAVVIGAGYWDVEPSPSDFIIDDFNILPSGVSWDSSVGALSIDAAYLGSTALSAIYIGDTQIWGAP